MSFGKTLWRAALALGLASAIGALPGCASETAEEDPDNDEAEVQAAGGAFGPALFRNDFYTYLKTEGRYSEEQIRQLVLLPTPEMIQPKVSVNPTRPLEAYDQAFKNFRPSQAYEAGLREPLVKKRWPLSNDLEGELRRRPIHIVIIPGIFGEFIPVSPFEEAFRIGGVAKVDFEKKVKDLARDPAKKALVADKQYSTTALGDIDKTLLDTLRVASLDSAEGKPIVTITYMKPELGSLESFGTLDENANYYLPRLKKYFDLIGMPDHLYIMGYSRGMATALNLVSRADKEHAPWVPHLKGVIGLAGVVYGSQLADAAMAPGAQHDMLERLREFVNTDLQSCGPMGAAGVITQNNVVHWPAFTTKMAYLLTKMGNHNEELKREGLDTAFADVGRFIAFTKRALFSDPNQVFDGSSADDGMTSGVLHLMKPGSEYCQNIDRFKKTAQQILKGVETLTTQSRMEWWKTHTLPTNVRYYALTGTMGDATAPGQQPHILVNTPVSNDPRSVDYKSLRGNYYDLLQASGTQLQDSQVPLQRGRFWDDVNQVLNPNQAPLKTYFMGTVGIHHWGLSFPRAFATHDGLDANPFPRTLLLKSIATFVAQVERRAEGH